MNTFSIHRRTKRGDESMSYLYLGFRPKGALNPKLKALKISIPTKYILGSSNDVKQISKKLPSNHLNGFQSVEQLNEFLQSQLLRAQNKLNPEVKGEKIFTDWLKDYIERILNHGTKMRYQNIYNLLVLFAEYKLNRSFILCEEIDKNFIMDFQNWLIKERGNNLMTIQFKIKALKALINHTMKDGFYHYSIHPFSNITFKNATKKNDILNIDELKKLIKYDFKEVYRMKGKKGEELEEYRVKNKRYEPKHTLNDIRNYFVFQVLAQGLRISDLLTLRWNNFHIDDNLYIRKRMIKTGAQIEIAMNRKAILLLSKIMKMEIETPIILYPVNINEKSILDTLQPDYIYNGMKWYNLNEDIFKAIEKTLYHPNPILYQKGLKTLEPIKKAYREEMELKLKELEDKILIDVEMRIKKLKEENPLDFVVPLLDSKSFYSLSKEEDFYSMNEDFYRKLQSQRCYYNKILKLIAEQAGISKNLTSHVSRHSYASLLLEMGESVNLFDIMSSLGHTRLSTTQTYLQSITNKKLINISNIISEKF